MAIYKLIPYNDEAMTYALSVNNVTKTYGTIKALDSVSFKIKEGEFFGFLGPNGAGKTTTIHLATGVNRMEEGSIELFGIDVAKEYRASRRCVGLSPQEFNVDIFKPIPKLLDYVGGYYGMKKRERKERIDELLERFELSSHTTKEFGQLSGGLKRRVMLARALMHKPKLLILDEPTAGVDVELRHDLWRYLQELNDSGTTILLTSHYLEEVEKLCDRIAIINKGVLVEESSISQYQKEGVRLEDRYLEVTKTNKT